MLGMRLRHVLLTAIDKRCWNIEASSEDSSLALGVRRGAENKGQLLTELRCWKRSDCLCHLEKEGSAGSAWCQAANMISASLYVSVVKRSLNKWMQSDGRRGRWSLGGETFEASKRGMLWCYNAVLHLLMTTFHINALYYSSSVKKNKKKQANLRTKRDWSQLILFGYCSKYQKHRCHTEHSTHWTHISHWWADGTSRHKQVQTWRQRPLGSANRKEAGSKKKKFPMRRRTSRILFSVARFSFLSKKWSMVCHWRSKVVWMKKKQAAAR